MRGPRPCSVRLLFLVGIALALAACAGPPPVPGPSLRTLTVFAAASLRDALGGVARAYRDRGFDLVMATDSSTALRTQLEQGAPADVFLAADTRNPEALVKAGLAVGDIVPFAGNRLAIVVPKDNPANVRTPADLGRPGMKIIAAGDSVPISAYAATLIEQLAQLPGTPAGFAAGYAANVVSREDNVRGVLTKIELGEGDAAIVYASDAAGSTSVTMIDIPVDANVIATYAGIVPASAWEPAAGGALLGWLAGPDGQAILGRYGFVAAP